LCLEKTDTKKPPIDGRFLEYFVRRIDQIKLFRYL
jgi:hypothetical protein